MLDSMPSNCFFHKTDITTSLPFADNTFDYCHVRLVLWGYRLNCFPDLLNELIRVTKKGGWIEFVDMDPCILKATETGTCINEWVRSYLAIFNTCVGKNNGCVPFTPPLCYYVSDQDRAYSQQHGSGFGQDAAKVPQGVLR
ncbi:hypothetical protein EDD21DRAFT_303592 [Dissophora ornata]|nr:hypothetical protein EDD21DRAFT_303592 [Dissophora ornata]